MKVLLDTCVWRGVRDQLKSAGHDVVGTGDWEKDPGDQDILQYAFREERVLVTVDKDFAELAIVYGMPHYGIVRLVNLSARKQGDILLQVLALHADELRNGAIITAEFGRLRIRPH